MKLLVISSFPEKGLTHGKKTVGVASYAKNTVVNIKKVDEDIEIQILAEIFDHKTSYKDDLDITVNRVWKRGSIISILSLVSRINSYKIDKTLAEFEMFMMGNSLHSLFYILVLIIERVIFRKKIYLVVHQVVSDVGVFEKNKLKRFLISLVRKYYYRLLLFSSTKSIVFEKELANRLANDKKCVVIPHAVEKCDIQMSQSEAKKTVNLDEKYRYILYFGYISPYKGIDELIDFWPLNLKGYRLIIAGGPNPNHMKDDHYMKFINNIYEKAKQKNIKITGFLEEKDIPIYYLASELLVLPYKTFMSSSGPLSIALSFSKPFLLSKNLVDYFKTEDFSKAIEKYKLRKEDLYYTDKQDFETKIKNITANYDVYSNLSSYVAEKRSWKNIAQMYYNLIFNN